MKHPVHDVTTEHEDIKHFTYMLKKALDEQQKLLDDYESMASKQYDEMWRLEEINSDFIKRFEELDKNLKNKLK